MSAALEQQDLVTSEKWDSNSELSFSTDSSTESTQSSNSDSDEYFPNAVLGSSCDSDDGYSTIQYPSMRGTKKEKNPDSDSEDDFAHMAYCHTEEAPTFVSRVATIISGFFISRGIQETENLRHELEDLHKDINGQLELPEARPEETETRRIQINATLKTAFRLSRKMVKSRKSHRKSLLRAQVDKCCHAVKELLMTDLERKEEEVEMPEAANPETFDSAVAKEEPSKDHWLRPLRYGQSHLLTQHRQKKLCGNRIVRVVSIEFLPYHTVGEAKNNSKTTNRSQKGNTEFL